MLDSFRHHLPLDFSEQHQNLPLGPKDDNDLLEPREQAAEASVAITHCLILPGFCLVLQILKF